MQSELIDAGAESDALAGRVQNRRSFLGAGLGCAVPLAVGLGSSSGERLLGGAQGDEADDPVFGHLADQAWRTAQEVQVAGLRGEHLRRIADQLDIFAVHLRGRGGDRAMDDEVQRRVRERGRDGVVADVLDRCRERAAPSAGPRRTSLIDEKTAGMAVDHVAARGSVKALRSHRTSLEKLAVLLDRSRPHDGGRVLPVHQKPGDDFLGYPDVPSADWCDLLRCLTTEVELLAMVAQFTPFASAARALSAFAVLLEIGLRYACPNMEA
jgi:hypothetical protein